MKGLLNKTLVNKFINYIVLEKVILKILRLGGFLAVDVRTPEIAVAENMKFMYVL